MRALELNGVGQDELDALEAMVRRALSADDESGLRVLGYGEISLVLALEARAGRFACKRLPRFDSPESLDAYRRSFEAYLAALWDRGVEVIETELLSTPAEGGGAFGYCVQPMLDPQTLAPRVLERAGDAEGEALVERIFGQVAATVSAHLGLDAQLSNWALSGGSLLYLDVTTPLLRDDAGREQLDFRIFVASLPWLLRGAVRRFVAPGIAAHYHDRRTVLVDFIANLHKERLGRWIPAALRQANRLVEEPITAEEARRYYAADARLWALLQKLRRLDRSWQRNVRGRPYPFLLPGEIRR